MRDPKAQSNPVALLEPPTPSTAVSFRIATDAPTAAPGGFFICRVDAVGPVDDLQVYIALTDTAQPSAFSAWYRVTESIKREALAVALTAISTGYVVQAWLASIDPYSECARLYVIRS
jgi:hypothetical protein